ncbi:MAG TPA: ABC transporter permease subunit [Longilinea sp.]|nr:ABC transporter permease subunit [Longilinea sp.]
MISDMAVIVWKEWKEVLLQRGSRRGGPLTMLLLLGIMGIFVPLQSGRAFLVEPTVILVWSWLPLFLCMSVVADAFAGERERHTLETLLASRLSDRAILFGKLAASVLYGWGLSTGGLLLGAVTINIAFPDGGIAFYDLGLFFSALAASLLASVLISALGVLISLKAESVRQAYQRLSLGFMAIWFIPMLFLQFAPASITQPIMNALNHMDLGAILPWAAGVVIAIDAALVVACMMMFQRSRLLDM